MTAFVSVTILAGSQDEAAKIAHALVEEKLAACANIIAHAQSIYRWQGKVEQAQEFMIIAKTTANKFAPLQLRVSELHSYECPCIVATAITAGNQPFLDWIAASLD